MCKCGDSQYKGMTGAIFIGHSTNELTNPEPYIYLFDTSGKWFVMETNGSWTEIPDGPIVDLIFY